MPPEPSEALNIAEYFLGNRISEGRGARRALLTGSGDWTYDEVQALASRFGNVLADFGVRPEERVIVSLADGPQYVGALFGVLRLGSVVVMVNPHLATEQIRYFLEYTRARAAVVDAAAAAAFREAASDARIALAILEVRGRKLDEALESASEHLAPFPSHRDDPAIWLFSGGTTGKPKAVVQTHRSFVNTTELYGKRVLGMGPDDVTLSVPKLFFGYATGANLFFPFSVGATSALFPERCTADTLFAKIARFRPTVLVNVPTMVNNLVCHPEAAAQDLSCLRLSTSAGEALPVELHRRWDDLFGVPLLDGLGTAEMWHVFISNRPGDARPGTLGKVVPGFDVKACDEDGREMDTGEVGYLWVKGDSRAIGYWQRMDETRRAFRGEWYVSGDMIRIDAEGYVTYCGRADDMLKVSGKWLSPQELENCLLEHDTVRDVAVVGQKTADGLVKPHAFVVLRDDIEPGEALADELRAWAKERLEPYKYPREVTFMKELPRTHLGKVDRGALAARG